MCLLIITAISEVGETITSVLEETVQFYSGPPGLPVSLLLSAPHPGTGQSFPLESGVRIMSPFYR